VASFIYLTPFFLYFPRFLPGVETQPLLATGVALLALLLGCERRAILGFAAVTWALLFWLVIKVLIDGVLSSALGLLQLLIGPLSLFGAIALKAPPPSRKLMAAVAIYFMACMAIEMLAPGLYGGLVSMLLSRASVADGHRGVSLFTPEPTYAALSVVYFLVLAWWSGKYWGFRHRWVEPALALCLIATGSTYVVLMLILLIFVLWPLWMLAGLTTAVVAIPMFGFVALDNDESIRAVVALSRLLSSDFTDFLPSISALDSSLGSRMTTTIASFLTPLHTPLGIGLDCSAVPKALEAAGFDFAFQNPVLSSVMDDGGCLKPQAYAAAIVLGLGASSLFFALILVLCCRFALARGRFLPWLTPLALAGIMLIVQGQLTSPIPWLLIYFAFARLPAAQHRASTSPLSAPLRSPI
jgi:hypothetical protein